MVLTSYMVLSQFKDEMISVTVVGFHRSKLTMVINSISHCLLSEAVHVAMQTDAGSTGTCKDVTLSGLLVMSGVVLRASFSVAALVRFSLPVSRRCFRYFFHFGPSVARAFQWSESFCRA